MIADATFLVDLARGDPGARAVLSALEEGSEGLRVPAPALAKFWEGVERSRRPPREQAALEALLLSVPGAPMDAKHALAAARILADASAAGVALDVMDAMVAGIALVEDEALLTRNAREFERVRELRVRTY